MSGCKPEEGIFPADGNTLNFTDGDMQLVISCQPVAGDQCVLTVTFTAGDETVLSDNPQFPQGQPCSKLGLAQVWEPFHDELLRWSASQDSTIADKARRLMAKALSEFLRRGIEIPL